jgi:hypothetical protein
VPHDGSRNGKFAILAYIRPMNRPLPLIAGLKLAAAETELACLKLALVQVKEDRDELRQERDDWRKEAEMLCAAKLRVADEQRFAPLERRPWWRRLARG